MKQLLLFLFLFAAALMHAATTVKIVATDGSGEYTRIQAAIDACPDNERSIVLIKNGIYNEQVAIGSKSALSAKKISLIGESADSVIITHHQARKSSGKPTFEDVCTVKLYTNDFYAENITIRNTATEGMAEALYSAGDRQTFRNCRILGYQDTYRSKKGIRCYFTHCVLQGAIDFIYGGGTIFFDHCTLHCVKGGGYIVAPEDRVKWVDAKTLGASHDLNLQFIFRSCMLTADKDVPQHTYYLGRPWNARCGAYYLNCTLGSHIKPEGWQTMGTNETTAAFGEYQSKTEDGRLLSTEKRVSWSFQLTKDQVTRFLQPGFVYAQLNDIPYDPIRFYSIPASPKAKYKTNQIQWKAIDNAAGYLIYRQDKLIAYTTQCKYVIQPDASQHYSIRTISTEGVLDAALQHE